MAYYPDSKVEISGFTAKYYDKLMNLITLGKYFSMIQDTSRLMEIKPSDRILDLGAGTGRNACLMMKYLSADGELIGLDISEEMAVQFKKKFAGFSNAKLINQRIDKPLPFNNEFDKVFISFVLHGFPQEVRKTIIKNAYNALKKNGEFFILDYNEFSLQEMPFYLKIPFQSIECPYAFDFIGRDWKRILINNKLNDFQEILYFFGYVRLLRAWRER